MSTAIRESASYVPSGGGSFRESARNFRTLDELKKINDRYGRIVGRGALCRLGDVLRVHCRAVGTDARAAGFVAARIRERLAMDNEQPPLSVSIGVADYPQGGETIEDLLRTADRELYGMKCAVEKTLR